MRSLHLFRRDLRVQDNVALRRACEESTEVYTAFVFTPEQVGQENRYRSINAIMFMLGALRGLSAEIQARGGSLALLKGGDESLKRHLRRHQIECVYWNRDHTPYAKARDEALVRMLTKMKVRTSIHDDYYLNAPGTVVTGAGNHYQKYTPYLKKALTLLKRHDKEPPALKCVFAKMDGDEGASDVLNEPLIHFTLSERENGLRVLQQPFDDYDETRDDLTRETTRLSASIKFGVLSIREVYRAFRRNEALIRQLIWRDFYAQLADDHPYVLMDKKLELKENYRSIRWSKNKEHFKRWCEGTTGYPIVDAGMRELNESGYMHNRARLITASFLVKTLLIDWRWGEQYFATKLVDYDPCSNNGNWQWVASTGADSQPYFRVFNPWSQSKKHDPDCKYITRWIPELKPYEPKQIHARFKYPEMEYHSPIVDYPEQKRKAIAMYKDGVMNGA